MSKDLFSGLPDELQDLMSDVEKSTTSVEIRIERRKYGKFWAVVSGLDLGSSDIKTLLKVIKNKMACGGTIKEKNIEILLGKTDKSQDLVKILSSEGFDPDSIHITKG